MCIRDSDVASLLEAFTASIWCGANRFLHTEVTRNDAALRTIFGWKNVPGQDAYKRYFNKFTQATNAEVCLLYTSDAADERSSVDLGGRRIIKKKKKKKKDSSRQHK